MTVLPEREGRFQFYPYGICPEQAGRGTKILLLMLTFTEMDVSISFWGQMSEMNCSTPPATPQQFNCGEKGRNGVRETNTKVIEIETHWSGDSKCREHML